MSLHVLLITALFLAVKNDARECSRDVDADNNRCEGVQCNSESLCATGFCYDNDDYGKSTCSTSNECASTPFNHLGRCAGVECKYHS
jgi:hypothetical protein